MSTAVGLDIGNSRCVVAVSTDGIADAILNEASKSETPTVVHFAKNHRLFGSAAASFVSVSPASTHSQLKGLVGSPIKIEVEMGREKRDFTSVQLLAMVLSHLKRGAGRTLGSEVSDCVIGVPGYFSKERKNAYRDAAWVAGWRPRALLDEGDAIALVYATERLRDAADGRVVAFVDIGHSGTQISVVRFDGEKRYVISKASDENLGGRDFDRVLFQYFQRKFKEEYAIHVVSNAKATAKLMIACEKAKKVLSANREARVSLESLVDDTDVKCQITRAEFERKSLTLVDRIAELFSEALSDADCDIHSVELVGSGSRIPAISRRLTEIFRREISRNINGSECVARGCALFCEQLIFNGRMENDLCEYVDLCPIGGYIRELQRQEEELEKMDERHESAQLCRINLESFIYQELNKFHGLAIVQGEETEKPSVRSYGSVSAFIDIDDSQTQVTLVSSVGRNMKLLERSCDRNLGGKAFDEVLFQCFVRKLRERYKIDVCSDDEACVRLREACQNSKKDLSAKKKSLIRLDKLMHGVDAKEVITIEELESSCSDLLQRIADLFCRVLSCENSPGTTEIQSIQLLGSGSWVPAIARKLQVISGLEVNRTPVTSECALRDQLALLLVDSSPREQKKLHSAVERSKGEAPEILEQMEDWLYENGEDESEEVYQEKLEVPREQLVTLNEKIHDILSSQNPEDTRASQEIHLQGTAGNTESFRLFEDDATRKNIVDSQQDDTWKGEILNTVLQPTSADRRKNIVDSQQDDTWKGEISNTVLQPTSADRWKNIVDSQQDDTWKGEISNTVLQPTSADRRKNIVDSQQDDTWKGDISNTVLQPTSADRR